MATFDLGRVTPIYKGDYDAEMRYELNDIVKYNGSIYWHYGAVPTGAETDPTNESVWSLLFTADDVRTEILGFTTRAETAAESAGTSAETATTKANAASSSASAAATSETNAAAYAESAAGSARSANTSKNSAASSASSADSSATSASSSASAAATSATNAANSASTASTKAAQATTAASTATTKASEASASASTASNKASEAAQSATDANSYKTAAQTAKTAAETAQSAAETAAASVSASAAQIETNRQDIAAINGSLDNAKADLGDKSNLKTLDKTNIVSAINSLNSIVRVIANRDTSWAGIKENVKSGYGEILYPVGTDFSVSCPSGAPYNDIVFTVVNHRIESGEPIMTLLMKRCIYGIQFDAIQAAFVASEAMAAGTYHFKLLDGYDTGYDGGKYVQFTIVNPLVAGDQIVITWESNQSWIGKNAYVYHAFDTTPTETCVMSEGQGGTYLGVADGSSANLNHTHRLRYGSNNWKESAVREWLNSDAQAGEWQTQQTKFQRPCSYASSKAGFISYLDPSFVAVVRTGAHLNRTNQVFDPLGSKVAYSTDERFFLLSNEELGFTSESGIVCGSLFSFYDGANNDDRIKYDIANENTARYWWLRTPYPSNAYFERHVNSSGALIYNNAYYGFGAAAACEI